MDPDGEKSSADARQSTEPEGTRWALIRNALRWALREEWAPDVEPGVVKVVSRRLADAVESALRAPPAEGKVPAGTTELRIVLKDVAKEGYPPDYRFIELEDQNRRGVRGFEWVEDDEYRMLVIPYGRDDEWIAEVAFQAAGAATRPLLEDHPDYVFPFERVRDAVTELLEDFGVEPRVAGERTPLTNPELDAVERGRDAADPTLGNRGAETVLRGMSTERIKSLARLLEAAKGTTALPAACDLVEWELGPRVSAMPAPEATESLEQAITESKMGLPGPQALAKAGYSTRRDVVLNALEESNLNRPVSEIADRVESALAQDQKKREAEIRAVSDETERLAPTPPSPGEVTEYNPEDGMPIWEEPGAAQGRPMRTERARVLGRLLEASRGTPCQTAVAELIEEEISRCLTG